MKFLDLFQNFNQADEFVCFKETQINPCINILIGSAVLYGRLLNKAGFDLTKTKITIDGLTQLQVLAPSHFQLWKNCQVLNYPTSSFSVSFEILFIHQDGMFKGMCFSVVSVALNLHKFHSEMTSKQLLSFQDLKANSSSGTKKMTT